MKDVRVELKSGEVLHGPLWAWCPAEGWFELAGEKVVLVQLKDVASSVEYGVMTSKDRVEDVDLLQRAREEGWET